jgi:hypothetical protein
MNEKYERFSALAEKRVNNAITSIRSVGRLTNRARYDYTDTDIKIIYAALKTEIDQMRDSLEGKKQERTEFKLR